MTFLDEISKTLTDKGREAAQKAKEVAEILQMKSQVSSEKSKVRDLYALIGKTYYKQHQGEVEESFAETFKEIDHVLANVAELEEKIRQLEGSKACPACGAVLNREAAFCSKCGASLVVVEQDLTVVEDSAFEEETIKEAPIEEVEQEEAETK